MTDIEGEVTDLRAYMRADEPLPDWQPLQWVNTLMVKAGQVAYAAAVLDGQDPTGLFLENVSPEGQRQVYRELMKAIAVCALDAIESFDQPQSGGPA